MSFFKLLLTDQYVILETNGISKECPKWKKKDVAGSI
jgi:hypothetical protein